ncbi:MAG: small-conductance mechanosensitive ion channel [Pyrinomonadaceae bacterium]
MIQVRTTSDTLWLSFTNAINSFMSFLPSLLGAIIVLIIGWIISGILARLIEKGLRAVGLERAVHHSGISDFIVRTGTSWTISKIIAELIKWFIRLIFIQAAANILGMPQITAIINSIVLFIPNIVVALVIIVVGALIAKFLAGVVRGSVSEMGVGNPNLLATLTRYAVLGFAIIAAINQLGIAAVVVNTLFIGLVGSIALAVGLAFGLGGRDVAAKITESWYQSGQTMAQAANQLAMNEDLTRPARPDLLADTPLRSTRDDLR